MNKLRTLLAAAGLGFFIDTAMAQENTASVQADKKYTISDFVRVNDNNFQEEVIEESYRRTVVVLYDSSCPSGDTAKKHSINLHNVLFDVYSLYPKAKFIRFDRCGLGIDSPEEALTFEKKYGDGSATISTAIYFNGNVYFRIKGSFSEPLHHENWVNGFSRKLSPLFSE